MAIHDSIQLGRPDLLPHECAYNKTQQKQQAEVGKDKTIVRAASQVVS